MPDGGAQPTKTPWHLWVVGVVSLLWNLVGALDFVMTQMRNETYMKGLTTDQLAFYYGFPLWVVVSWGIAVWTGVLGSLFLLLRRRMAVRFFLWSPVFVVLTCFHNYVLARGLKVMGGPGALAFSAVIFVIAVLLFAYARAMARRGVLG
jgi:hypothetical protein